MALVDQWQLQHKERLQFASYNRVLTQDKLKKKGMILVNRCPLGRSDSESVNHLAEDCRYVNRHWMNFKGINPELNSSHSFGAEIISWTEEGGSRDRKQTCVLFLFCFWRERCRRLLDKEERLNCDLLEVVRNELNAIRVVERYKKKGGVKLVEIRTEASNEETVRKASSREEQAVITSDREEQASDSVVHTNKEQAAEVEGGGKLSDRIGEQATAIVLIDGEDQSDRNKGGGKGINGVKRSNRTVEEKKARETMVHVRDSQLIEQEGGMVSVIGTQRKEIADDEGEISEILAIETGIHSEMHERGIVTINGAHICEKTEEDREKGETAAHSRSTVREANGIRVESREANERDDLSVKRRIERVEEEERVARENEEGEESSLAALERRNEERRKRIRGNTVGAENTRATDWTVINGAT